MTQVALLRGASGSGFRTALALAASVLLASTGGAAAGTATATKARPGKGQIVFTSDLNPATLTGAKLGSTRVLSVPAAGGARRAAWPAGLPPGGSVSPDGKRYAYVDDSGLAVVDRAGGPPHTIVAARPKQSFRGEGINPPAWSPDGTRLALTDWESTFLSQAEYFNTFTVLVVDLDGTIEKALDDARNPAWSPDGERLAVESPIDQQYGLATGIAVVSASGPGRLDLVRPDDYVAFPTWSPGGESIAFTGSASDPAEEFGDESIYVARADRAAKPHRLGRGTHPVWSPLGTRIAFLGVAESGLGLFTSRPDGSVRRRLTRPGGISGVPIWSPDGTRLAFSYRRGALWQFVVLAAAGGKPRPLTTEPASRITPMRWAAGMITYARVLVADTTDIWTAHPDGSGLRRLTKSTAEKRGPALSPDGRKIAFWRVGPATLFVMSSAGGTVRRINAGPRGSHVASPDWSPDGRQLLFSRWADASPGRSDSFVFGADGGHLRRVTSTGGASDSAWSPDGRTIAFTNRGRISVVGIDGTNLHRVAEDLECANPAWSPDGSSLAFSCLGDRLLVVAPLAGGSPRVVDAASTGFLTSPSWSPDGARIVYEGAHASLRTIDVSGGAPAVIDLHGATGREPDWSR